MRQKPIIWTLAIILFAMLAVLAARFIPAPVLEGPMFGVGAIIVCILLAFIVRRRFRLGAAQSALFELQARRPSFAPTAGGALIAFAFLWIAASLLYLTPTVGNSLIPFFVLLIFGWSVLTWTSELVQRNGKVEVLIGVALIAGSVVWLIISAGAFNPGDPKAFAIVFVPTLSLAFVGLLALATPLWVRFLRFNGVIR